MKTQSGRMLFVAFVSIALTAILAEQAQAAGFVSVSPMKRGRNYHTATLLPDGKALVAGGAQSPSATSAELYDPKTDTWTDTGAMRAGHAFHTATLLHNGKVLVASGTTAELFDPASKTWSRTGPMRRARSGHTATLLPDGAVLVTGGGGGEKVASAELYDGDTGT